MSRPPADASAGVSGLCPPGAGGGRSGPIPNAARGSSRAFGVEPVSGRGEQGQPYPALGCSSLGPGSLCRSRCRSGSGARGAPAATGGFPRVRGGVPAAAGGGRGALGSGHGAGPSCPRGCFGLGDMGCGADSAGERKPEIAVVKRCPACAGLPQ